MPGGRELSGDEEAAAVAALPAAWLCRKAGADPEAIPVWVAEGRRRRAAAKRPLPSGGVHGGGGVRRPESARR